MAPTANFGTNYQLRNMDMEPQQVAGMVIGLITFISFLIWTLVSLTQDFIKTDKEYTDNIAKTEEVLAKKGFTPEQLQKEYQEKRAYSKSDAKKDNEIIN